jgi:small-conductance mechanosensitive channel
MTILSVIKDFFFSPIRIGSIDLPFNYAELLFEFILPFILYIILYRLIVAGVRNLFSRSHVREDIQNTTVLWLRRALLILMLLLFFLLVGRLFGAEIFSYLRLFFSFLSKPFFESGSTKISLITIILAIPIFYLASWVAKVIRSFVDKTLLSRLSLDEARKFSISSVIRYGTLILALLFGLSLIGLDFSSLAVIFGALGIGLGFGLQNVIANFFAGLVIIFSRPIKEGDRILVHNSEGTVISIRLISTVINTITNESIIVPNSQIVGEKVYNYSFDDRSIIILNPVQVSYATDLDFALSIIKEVGGRNPYALPRKESRARVESFDDSGITLLLLIWIRDVEDKYNGLSWNNLEIWREFKRNGIEIPFPQRDIHLKENK